MENLKKDLDSKKLAESTKRSKVTGFIAQQKSRQEFTPLIGKLIDRAHVDPLHLKNNACTLANRQLLQIASRKTKVATNSFLSFSGLPNNCALVNVCYCFILQLHINEHPVVPRFHVRTFVVKVAH